MIGKRGAFTAGGNCNEVEILAASNETHHAMRLRNRHPLEPNLGCRTRQRLAQMSGLRRALRIR